MILKTLRLQLRFLLPLAAVLVAAAYLAVPLMDLKLEKEALLAARGIPAAAIDFYHFTAPPAAFTTLA